MSDKPVLTDFDHNLHEEMRHLLDIGMPSRIYGEAFRVDADLDETEQSHLIAALIDAAIWGAQNAAFVLAVEERRKSEDPFPGWGDDEGFDGGPMQ